MVCLGLLEPEPEPEPEPLFVAGAGAGAGAGQFFHRLLTPDLICQVTPPQHDLNCIDVASNKYDILVKVHL